MKASNAFVVRDLPKIVKPTNVVCKECVIAKQKKSFFPSKEFSNTTKLEIVHTNLSGPTKTRGFYGERYFMIFVDDFTRMMWVVFLKENFEAFEKFKLFKNRVENESGVKINWLRSNGGREFTSNEFTILCQVNDIKRQLSAPKTLEQNGIVERRKKCVIEASRATMFENDVSKTFWREAVIQKYTQ